MVVRATLLNDTGCEQLSYHEFDTPIKSSLTMLKYTESVLRYTQEGNSSSRPGKPGHDICHA